MRGEINLTEKNEFFNTLLRYAEDGFFAIDEFEKDIKSGNFNSKFFEKKEFRVRTPKLSDIPDLLELEAQCWDEGLRIQSDEIERRIISQKFDLFVIEYEGRVVAVNYTHRINEKDIGSLNSKNLMQYSNYEGDTVQLIALNVLPSFQDRAWGSDLLEFVLEYFSLNERIKSIFAITRCRDFYKSGLNTLEEYFKRIHKNGKFNDPILNFHQGHGATVLGLVKNYRPEDTENHGYGVMVRYVPSERKWGWQNHHISNLDQQYDEKKEILKFINNKVGEGFSKNTILSDIGLDSLDVTELVVLVNSITDKNISFENINKITTTELLELVQGKNTLNNGWSNNELENTSDSLLNRIQSGIKKYPELVPLSIESEGPCTFWIHPLSGDVGIYKDISSYAKGKFKVIGIKSKGLLSKIEVPFNNIDDMTEYYLKIIRDVQPKGPYHLAGFSLGGTIAYELTNKLQKLGEDVENLIMIESPFVSLTEDEELFNTVQRNNLIMNANFLLMSLIKGREQASWITDEELNFVSEDDLVEQLAYLLKEKGVKSNLKDIMFKITSMAQVHYSNLNILKVYRPTPLPKPEEVNCTHYITSKANATSKMLWNPDYLEKVQYSKGSLLPLIENWNSLLPDMKTLKISGESHLDIFSNSKDVKEFVSGVSMILSNAVKDENQTTDIAIIGISGRFPGANNIDEFWDNVKNGVSSINLFPDNRDFNINDYYDSEMKKPGKTYSKWGGFLEEIEEFDSLFFNISPKEASMMDPSERIFLEESWKAIEDAGYDPESLSGKKWGVFSSAKGDYSVKLWNNDSTYFMPTSSYPAGRLAYHLNLTGPAMSVDSACSSTLSALAVACDNLVLKNCETAIVGGGGINSTPNVMISSSQSLLFSPEGKCSPFDEEAKGTVMGEAICTVILKSKEKAIEDGNHIYCIIKGWGINQDGKTNGQTAPNGKAQSSLHKSIYDKFNIDPNDISLVEAHGTGTKLGDQVEFDALANTFHSYAVKPNHCSLGSVKANVGHTFFASGLVSLIKVIMAINNKIIPPLINLNKPNPKIDISNSPFYFSRTLSDWKSIDSKPRMAAINSFGVTGTNVHVVIEEFKNKENYTNLNGNSKYAVVISARKKDSLYSNVKALKKSIETEYMSNVYLPSISFTLQQGRTMMNERVGFLVENIDDLRSKLNKFLNNESTMDIYFGSGKVKKEKGSNSVKTQEEFLKLWIKGHKVDWSLLYEQIPQLVSLPTYCFHDFSLMKSNNSSNISNQKEWNKDIHVFSEEWKETEILKVNNHSIKKDIYFINDDKDKEIIKRITNHQAKDSKSVFISKGSNYRKVDNESYVINGEETLSYTRVFEDIAIDLKDIDNILFLWPLTSISLNNEYKRIVKMIKAIFSTSISVKNILITGYKRDAISRSYIDSWIGFERSLSNKLTFKVVAFEQKDNSTYLNERVIEKSLEETELDSKSVTYQDNKRYELKLIKQNLDDREVPIKQGGTYLISGGLGGLGVIFSKYLSREYNANLILTGRSKYARKQAELLYEINSLGGKAEYFSGDISNEKEMVEVFRAGENKFGEINGVIHAAGLANHTSIVDKTITEFENTLVPKVEGSIIIQKVAKSRNIDFICNFSSSAAILGDFGVCDYSVANRFLMSFDSDQKSSTKVISINWPLWRNGGMGLGHEKDLIYIEKTGQKLLDDQTGVKLFEKLLTQGLKQTLVLYGKEDNINNFLQKVLNNNQAVETIVPTKNLNKVEYQNLLNEHELTEELKLIIGDVQGISPSILNDNEHLSVYGIDSISMFDLAKKINIRFQANLPVSSLVGLNSLNDIKRALILDNIVISPDKNIDSRREIKFESKEEKIDNHFEKLNILVQKDIVSIISATQSLAVADISLDKYIGEYGIDSIGLFDITKRLSEIFNMNLSASELINSRTIIDISTYLMNKFFDTINQHYLDKGMVQSLMPKKKYKEENIIKYLDSFIEGDLEIRQLLEFMEGSK